MPNANGGRRLLALLLVIFGGVGFLIILGAIAYTKIIQPDGAELSMGIASLLILIVLAMIGFGVGLYEPQIFDKLFGMLGKLVPKRKSDG